MTVVETNASNGAGIIHRNWHYTASKEGIVPKFPNRGLFRIKPSELLATSGKGELYIWPIIVAKTKPARFDLFMEAFVWAIDACGLRQVVCHRKMKFTAAEAQSILRQE